MKPLVSIMIATYNQSEFILMCLESCLKQDYDNLEIIVGDDSINDSTFNIIKPFLSIQKVKYHRNVINLGRVKNYRNLLFNHSKGDWVLMLDGDDYYSDSSYISKAVSFIQNDNSIVLVAAGHFVYDVQNDKCLVHKLVEEDTKFDGKEIFYKNLKLGQHSTNLYKKDLAINLDFYRLESVASDSESLFRLCLHGKVVYFSNIVVCWRIHNNNITFKTENVLKQMNEMVFIDWVYKYSLKYIDFTYAKIWRIKMYKSMSYHIINLAERSGNLLYLIRVLFWCSKFWKLSEIFQYFKNRTLNLLNSAFKKYF
jgi:glycosyltransferase involved in cell wall biosynthesis